MDDYWCRKPLSTMIEPVWTSAGELGTLATLWTTETARIDFTMLYGGGRTFQEFPWAWPPVRNLNIYPSLLILDGILFSTKHLSQFLVRSGRQLQGLQIGLLEQDIADPGQLFLCMPQLCKLVLNNRSWDNSHENTGKILTPIYSQDLGVVLPRLSVLEVYANAIFTGISERGNEALLHQVRIYCKSDAKWFTEYAPTLSRIERLKSFRWKANRQATEFEPGKIGIVHRSTLRSALNLIHCWTEHVLLLRAAISRPYIKNQAREKIKHRGNDHRLLGSNGVNAYSPKDKFKCVQLTINPKPPFTPGLNPPCGMDPTESAALRGLWLLHYEPRPQSESQDFSRTGRSSRGSGLRGQSRANGILHLESSSSV
ncbi:hypothetical protein EDD85DRAFT_792888 [Armillaria nabsnona]|nr:hypothetical protein EDD85DRAFT_792888 [Armillaria nabsnona]